MVKNINIILPPQFNFIILKNKNNIKINLYNTNYKFNIFLKNNKSFIFTNKYNNILKIEHKKIINNQNLINSSINSFLKLLDIYKFIKIKFKGKGFKIGFYKNKNIMNFFFGSSHINIFVIKNMLIKKISKYKFILKSNNLKNINQVSKKIVNIRKINFYTLRGLRQSRQFVIKRKGRKGTFI
jgi:ribosomal protein L6P/L9E